ncbi:MAG: saccharopine dehydrogenase C-terminal domain-containing protein, partial [Bacteroidota bacterium]
ATNFNPEINIREITQKGMYYQDGQWKETEPHEISQMLNYPNIGPKNSYLIYHEELESLVKHIPSIKRARFWMTFGEEYLTHLRVIQNIGMAGIEPVKFKGVDIVPLEFLKAVLPDPGELGENYVGETSIGCRIKGIKAGQDKTYYIWNNCSHEAAFKETGAQGVSYTTGVPATLGALLMMEGIWSGAGVFNVEQMDPDPFLSRLGNMGLSWQEKTNIDTEFIYEQ